MVWFGPELDGCSSSGKIYVRRFEWDGTDPDAAPAAVGPEFIVNSSTSSLPAGGTVTRPALAITNATGALAGRFIVAWNVGANGTNVHEVHAQYFAADGRPMGGEFTVNQVPGHGGDNVSRRIANSAQHTVAYGPSGEVVIVWTRLESGNNTAHFTRLPDDYAEYQESLVGCLKGDVDRNGLVNGLDIQPFIDLLLGNPLCLSIVDICPADMESDLDVDLNDLPCFVATLLDYTCTGLLSVQADCNTNGIPDINDIAVGTSEDCNTNGVPDECDIDESDPDGNELVSADVNTNGIPDECEDDCNGNDVPDDWDIAQSTSDDVNTDGVPDECQPDCNTNGLPDDWDIAQATSADCNGDGEPDECEQDCNTNGVPDECDVDPSDPDGDEWVSPDCNGNGFPDECDLALGAGFGSLDCNTNGIPDECDIASCASDPACDDCNENGIPDSCDIAAEISEDANTNGIPDECEGEGMMGGGESTAEGGYTTQVDGEFDEEAAWEAFYEWAATRCWGPDCETNGAEQFAAMVAKLKELGLPVTGQTMGP